MCTKVWAQTCALLGFSLPGPWAEVSGAGQGLQQGGVRVLESPALCYPCPSGEACSESAIGCGPPAACAQTRNLPWVREYQDGAWLQAAGLCKDMTLLPASPEQPLCWDQRARLREQLHVLARNPWHSPALAPSHLLPLPWAVPMCR